MPNKALKILVVLVPILANAAVARGQAHVTVPDVERAWQAHAAKLGRLEIHWEQKRTSYKGSLTDALAVTAKDGSTLPKSDESHSEPCALWLDGGKARLEWEQKAFNTFNEDWRPVFRTYVFDGKTALTYNRQSSGPAAQYSAVRQRDGIPPELKVADLLPVLRWARPTDPAYSTIDLNQYEPSGARTRIRGADCVEFRRMATKSGAAGSIWLDPSRQYLVVRLSLGYAKGSAHSGVQEDIEYSEHAPGVWVPTRWSMMTLGWTVRVASKVDASVVSVEIGPPIDKTRFDVTPPPQAVLTDRSGKDKTVSIVRERGAEEEVPDGRVSSALQQLESPPKQRWGWLGRHPLLAVSIVVSGLVLTATWVRHRRAKSRPAA